MALIKQNGPSDGKVMTTMGMKNRRAPVCWTCRERRHGELYGFDANGSPICSTCRDGYPNGLVREDDPSADTDY